jgi:ParB family transcriptional regulator, chromosome partitioning protein
MSVKRQALGKGLGALLQNPVTDITTRDNGEKAAVVGSVSLIDVSQIEANPFQPRTNFDKEALSELVESIRQHGIIQPVTVRKMGYDKYQLISGERRFRASQLAGLTEIPAYVRIANDQSMLEMALVENIQRHDLDAIEVAMSYKRLIDECNLTQEELSDKVSKQRSTITNYLRLLKLPVEIQLGIRDREISMGHARALINIEDPEVQMALFKRIVEDDLSVRQVEELARELKAEDFREEEAETMEVARKQPEPVSFEHQKFASDLSSLFKTKVDFKRQNNGKGKIVITFASDEELNRIREVLAL